jgi:8-oxo-(d)GTP phosphatase
MTAPELIRAAGGVVWRRTGGGAGVEIALVHRPRYDDWSLPKGKLEAGESELAAAVREVGEEAGAEVVVSRYLRRIAYDVGPSRKHVDFWAMRHAGGTFEAGDEVDELRWLAPREARAALTYDVEREVVDAFTAQPPAESVVVLVRHAKAGKRSEWDGDDRVRPLDPSGRRQADRLVAFLKHFGPDRVVSAAPRRCVQTVEPLAATLGTEVAVDPAFGDEAWDERPDAALAALTALAKPGHVTVVASQGSAIPGIVAATRPDVAETRTRKGAAWVLSFVDGEVAAADYYGAAAR